MEKKFRLFLLLVLLMTAATGAWAQDAKHLITATYDKQTRLLEQPLPYATTVGELYEAITGQSFSDLLTTMTAMQKPLTGIRSTKTDVVSIGELNGASTPVTVTADGKATVALNFSGYVIGSYVTVTPPLYAYMKDGVKDADKWTVKVGDGQAQALPIGGLKGNGSETVTLQYNGRLKVKGVTATSEAGAPAVNIVDLSKLTENTELKDGDVLTGTLASNVKISIADGATVTLDGVTINGVNDINYEWAGITCLGDATIILSGTNTVNGFYQDYPGIQAAAGKTLIINGTGSLTASSLGKGAGIGGANNVACGNIEIQGGTITATSGQYGAGIGGGDRADCGNITISGGTINATGGARGAGIGGGRRGPDNGSCGNILISGGTVTATGGENAAGIGGGRGYNNSTFSSCGTITIANTVTKVTATMGDGAPYSIGAGRYGTCGTVTIGGVEGAITNSPYTYDPTAPAAAEGHALSASVVGDIVGTDGKAYAAADKDNLPTGVTAVAMVAYKSATAGSSLAIAHADEGSMNWATAKSTCEGKTAIGGNSWKLPSQDDWKQMFSANGGNEGSYTGLNSAITTAGGTVLPENGDYWSSTPNGDSYTWDVFLSGGAAYWYDDTYVGDDLRVRACLAF